MRSDNAWRTLTAIRISLGLGVLMSNVDTAEVPVVRIPLLGPTVRKPLSVFGLLDGDRVRPRIAETEPSREFLGGKFGGRFNDCPQRVAVNPCEFLVGMVDAPKLIRGLLRHRLRRIHAASEHDAASRQVRIAHFLAARGSVRVWRDASIDIMAFNG